ncbi:hypothetical protein BH10PSE12_BH10PSE12_05660 [soil metagenome]
MSSGEVFVVIEVAEVLDLEGLQQYQKDVGSQLSKWGGTMIARGGTPFEGDPPLGPIVVQRWPSEDLFRRWQESDDYGPLHAIRIRSMKLRTTIVAVMA